MVEMQIALAVTAFLCVSAYSVLNAIDRYQSQIIKSADREDLAAYIRMVATDSRALANSLNYPANNRMQKCFKKADEETIGNGLCKTGRRYNFTLVGPEPQTAGNPPNLIAGTQAKPVFYSQKGRRCVETDTPTLACPLAVYTTFEIFGSPDDDRGPASDPKPNSSPEIARIIYTIEIPERFLADNPSLSQGQVSIGKYESAITVSFGDLDMDSLGL